MTCNTAPLFATTILLFYFTHSYHEVLVAKYGCKREKSQEAKWRSAEEQRPVCEMERALDVDLFLGAQDQWTEDSPHLLQSSMRCSYMLPWKEGKRQNGTSAKASGGKCPS